MYIVHETIYSTVLRDGHFTALKEMKHSMSFFGNSDYFYPLKLPFWRFNTFYSKNHQINGFGGFKNHQNMKRTIFISKCRKLNIMKHCVSGGKDNNNSSM